MTGIYKITSPSGKIYIGQSNNIEYRFNQYKRLQCKTQTKLYNSLIKHGFSFHLFEIITICDEKELNEKERYFQDMFNCISKNGLNCRLTQVGDKQGQLSEETKRKISNSNKGKARSQEVRDKISLANIDGKNGRCLKVICTKTGKTWLSVKIAANENNLNYTTLMKRLRGIIKNETTLKYLVND